MAKAGRKAQKRLEGRINGWMASPKAQKDPRAYKKPGSMRR